MHNPTEEQAAIVTAARDTNDNILVNALAGAAKTSTLELIANALPEVEILCLAFNKKIAVEMQARMPDNVKAMTLNSLGHRTWSAACGRRLIVESDKIYNLMSTEIKALPPEEQRLAYDRMAELMRIVSFGKQCGYIPSDHYETTPRAKRLMDDDEFFDHIEQDLNETEIFLIREVTLASLRMAFEGKIDYDDQILMPTIFMGAFPRYQLTLVDEAQDLSALNHRMIQKFAKKRIIAVGDECQAIYGFRGAHQDSMEQLRKTFSMRKLILSISFRCPISIVEAARWRAPHMQYPDWAKPGEVTDLQTWSASALPPSDVAIICRNNAPLFKQAIRLIKAGRYPKLVGNDIGKNLLKIMNRFGKADLPIAEAEKKLARWVRGRLKKARDPAPIEDQADCIRVFFEDSSTLGEAVRKAEHLFSMSGPIELMTGHRSKGLEFEHVFFLDQDLCKDKGQDRNLKYVIQTRAKSTLTYVTTEGWME